ncbi:DUF1844 domain-containing protein [Elusimicrobiota bacterium]
MNDKVNPEEQIDISFFNIVISLSQAALVGMGKISNPQNGNIEKHMELARINIDILQMLKDKTKGNLTKKETEVITDTLTNLHLTFADEAKKDAAENKAKSEEAEKTEESDTPEQEEAKPEEADAPEQEEEKKEE